MKQIVEFPLSTGGFVYAEVDTADSETAIRRTGAQADIVRAAKTFHEAIEAAKPAVEEVLSLFRGLTTLPDELCLEFGLKLNGKVGTVFASAAADAHYTVTLKWQRDAPTK